MWNGGVQADFQPALHSHDDRKPVYASNGNGTGVHLSTEMFKHTTGINVAHVPYKSAGPAAIALLSGEVEAMKQP
jgi:tripartite-type tricarboxylate transporter receptor subunit TctC